MSVDSSQSLASAEIDPRIWSSFPDYSCLLVTVDGLQGGASDERSDALLRGAEERTRQLLAEHPVAELPEVQAWRSAFLTFGVKHRVGRSSVESLLRRCEKGLPRVDRITDLYNSISVSHRLPIGGEDFGRYSGPPRLVVADGGEAFDTIVEGHAVDRPAEAREVVWRDDLGITCRRWNWRQCQRTRLTSETTHALFIIDGLGAGADDRVMAAGAALRHEIDSWWPAATIEQRLLTPGSSAR